MLDKRSLHMKVQEQADCFASADPLSEMAGLVKEQDAEEGALKWIALAVLHGIDRNAKKISIRRDSNGQYFGDRKVPGIRTSKASGTYRPQSLRCGKGITHIEGDKGTTPVLIGIRDSSIEIELKLDHDGAEEEIVLEFPN